MTEFTFHCPHCRQKFKADEIYKGQLAECPSCHNKVIIMEDVSYDEDAGEQKINTSKKDKTTSAISYCSSNSSVNKDNEKYKQEIKEHALYLSCAGIITITLIIFIALVMLLVRSCSSTSRGSDKRIEAYVLAEHVVKQRLKSPKTAEFEWGGSNKVEVLESGVYLINSYVDSQNSFGVTVRTKFICRLQYTNGQWKLLDFSFGDFNDSKIEVAPAFNFSSTLFFNEHCQNSCLSAFFLAFIILTLIFSSNLTPASKNFSLFLKTGCLH